MSKKKESYENALSRLSTILENIQNNEISLDELPKEISTANELIKACKAKLRSVETQIEVMSNDSDQE